MKILSTIIIAAAFFVLGCGTETTVKEVSVEQAKAAVTDQKAQFIDVRTTSEFAGEHAETAVSCPLDSMEAEIAKLDKTKPVYVICQSGKRSMEGAKKLQAAGFEEVFSVAGGTNAWKQKGLPIAKAN